MDPDSSDDEKLTKRDKWEIKTLAHQICSIWLADLKKEEEKKKEEAGSTNNTSKEEEEDDEDKDSCESDQEWDVDSFEGDEFHSEDEPEDEDWRRYARQCYKSEGFDVDFDYLPKSKTRIYTGFFPVNLDDPYKGSSKEVTWRQHSEMMINVVIEKYNQSKGKTLVLDHIVRTVVRREIGIKAYITFMAKESPEGGELVEYQGKVEWKVWQRNYHPLLCRPASEQRQRD